MTNKQFLKKIEKYKAGDIQIYEDGSNLYVFEYEELTDLIKDICKRIVPEGYTKPENTDFGYELCRTDTFENIYDLFEDNNNSLSS